MSGREPDDDDFDPEKDAPRRDRQPEPQEFTPEEQEERPIDISPDDVPEGETLPEDMQPPEGLGEGVEISPTPVPFALERFLVEQPDGEFRVEVDVGGKQNTVEPRDIFRFEDQLIDDLVEDKTEKYRRGANIPVKGPWIHGWLKANNEDYIANIFRNYQLFLKYVEGKTSQMNNRGTVNRAPGTYDSMYTYLMVLEKLGLVERFKREEIPEGQFDHPVPDDFQDRTFLRVTTPIEDEPEKWRNPFKARYGEGGQLEEERGEVDDEPDDGEDDEEQEEIEEEVEETEEELDEEEKETPPEDVTRIDDVKNPGAFSVLIEDPFNDALAATLDDPPVAGAADRLDVDQFDTGRIAVYGDWAEGDATAQEDELKILFEVMDVSAPNTPTFIPLQTAARIEQVLNQENPVDELFPSYDISAAYTRGFATGEGSIKQRVEATQENDEYYELTTGEFIEV